VKELKKERTRKPFRYEGYRLDIINVFVSLCIMVMFVAIVVGITWRIKYMFIVTGAGSLFNFGMGEKFKNQKRYVYAVFAWIFAGILFILCMCDIFRFAF